MHELEWVEEPPPDVRKASERAAIVAQLKMSPGRWALVETDVSNSRAANYRRYGCEAVSRKRPEHLNTNKGDIYARWPEGREE